MIARVMLVVLVALTLGVLTCLTIYAEAARVGVSHWDAVAVGTVVTFAEGFGLAWIVNRRRRRSNAADHQGSR